MKKSKFLIGLICILILLIVACSSQQATAPEKSMEKVVDKSASSGNVVNVAIKGFKFAPADVTVKLGDTVVWTNQDSAPHTVESADGVLKSDELSTGDTYSWTAKKAGTHDYKCGIHPSMHGSVTVQ